MVYCRLMLICPRVIRNKTRTWILRISGLLFLYIGFSFGPIGTLEDTRLAQSISSVYPSWQHFVADIVVAITCLAFFSLALHALLQYEKKHQASGNIKKITKWLDLLAIRNLLDILSAVIRWSIAFLISLLIMKIVDNTKLGYVPSFDLQPIVYAIAILGLVCIIESFAFWQIGLHRLFCVHVK